jgi:hypothetical protein
MDDGTSAPKRCTVCGDPLRTDNTIGICTDLSKRDCANARKREYRSRNPLPYEPRPRTKQCEICGKPLNANNKSGLCNGKDSTPCKQARNQRMYAQRSPEPEVLRTGIRYCETCGCELRSDNEMGICGDTTKPACNQERKRRQKAGFARDADRLAVTAGEVFGRWTALESARNVTEKVRCRCECGAEHPVLARNLALGISRDCGREALLAAAQKRFPNPYIAAGTVFGRLTVLDDVARSTDPARCLCECGTETLIKKAPTLKAARSRSCGCLRREMNTTHGLSKHPLYKEWYGMVQRCTNPKTDSYPEYGGRRRPIKVCERWMDIAAFIEDIEREIGPRPAGRTPAGMPLYTLDRLDPDGDYEPGRVKWSTQSEQGRNRRKIGTVTEQRDAYADMCDVLTAEVARLTQLLEEHGLLPDPPAAAAC